MVENAPDVANVLPGANVNIAVEPTGAVTVTLFKREFKEISPVTNKREFKEVSPTT